MAETAREQHLENMKIKWIWPGWWRIVTANDFPVSEIFETRAEAVDELERRRHDLEAMKWEDS